MVYSVESSVYIYTTYRESFYKPQDGVCNVYTTLILIRIRRINKAYVSLLLSFSLHRLSRVWCVNMTFESFMHLLRFLFIHKVRQNREHVKREVMSRVYKVLPGIIITINMRCSYIRSSYSLSYIH